MTESQKKDQLLDHDADGIQEYDNMLPRWWLYGFYFTIVFSIAYMVYYHILDGPLSIAEYQAEVQSAESLTANKLGGKLDMAKAVPLSDAASLAKGKEIYESTNNLCFTCHREDLGGMVGPNLTDEYWIHGCSLQDIVKNISEGFPDKGMLPYGSNAQLSDEQLLQVASYILSKKGSNPTDSKPIEADREIMCE